jgi:hypothetical protein
VWSFGTRRESENSQREWDYRDDRDHDLPLQEPRAPRRRGWVGIVYKAADTILKRAVAPKFLPPELTRHLGAKTCFTREAQAASALQHANVCVVYAKTFLKWNP